MLSSDFLFPRFFVVPLANPSNFHIANVFLVGFPFFFSTSGTSRGSTEVQEEKTGLIRHLLEYLWTNNSVMSIAWYVEFVKHACQRKGARAEHCEEKQHLRLWNTAILGTRFLSHAYLLLQWISVAFECCVDIRTSVLRYKIGKTR